jgi:hypothetical protein
MINPQHESGQPQDSDKFKCRDGYNIFWVLASGHATCVTPFIRSGFGQEGLGYTALASLIVIILAMSATSDPAFIPYLWVWLAAVAFQRLRTGWLLRKGWKIHSRSAGWPWLAMLFPFMKDDRRARLFEPMLCLILGALLCPFSENLGEFVMVGFVSLAACTGIENEVARKQKIAARDAAIEMRYYAGLYEEKRR